MHASEYEKKTSALAAYQRWFEDAGNIYKQFRNCGMTPPEELARFMGIPTGQGKSNGQPRMVVPRPEPDHRPPGASEDWIWVEAREAVETTLVLGLLRQRAPHAIAFRELFELMVKLQPDANEGTLHNIGSRLVSKGIIARVKDGWKLLVDNKAPIFVMSPDGTAQLWGRPEIFQVQDVASFRRMLIRHVLSAAPGGLMNVQLVELLAGMVPNVPVNKDLLKADIIALQHDGVIKRAGNTKKYKLCDTDE